MMNILFIGDMHLETGIPQHFSYVLVKELIKDIQPDHIVIIGDMFDFSYLGRFNEAYEELREGKRLQEDIDIGNNELDFLQANSSGVSFLEGNHDYRLTRTIQKYPNILKGMVDLPSLLSLDKRQIRWFPEMVQPVKVLPDFYAIHGKRYNIHFAKKVVEDYSVSMVQGHTHRLQTYAKSFLGGRTISAYGMGCLCSTNPSYTNGYPTGHNNGFGILETDGNTWNFHNMLIRQNGFIWQGKHYKP